MTNIDDLGANESGVTEEVLVESALVGSALAESALVESALVESVRDLRAELDEMRSEIARLDADLGESRKLNLRAAELLDIVYERLGSAAPSTGPSSSNSM